MHATACAPLTLLRSRVAYTRSSALSSFKCALVSRPFSAAAPSAPPTTAPPAAPPAAPGDDEDDDAFFRRVARDYRRRTTLAEAVVVPSRLANGEDGGGLEMLYARNRAAMLGIEVRH